MSNEKAIAKTGEQYLIAEEVAIIEVKAFVEYHQDIEISDDRNSDDYVDIAKSYKNIVKAVKRGQLSISAPDCPILQLREPIKDETGSVVFDKINFKTRILKSTMAQLSKGFDVVKNPIGFANIMTAYYTQVGTPAMLDRFGKTDMAIIDEVVGLFQ